MSNKLSISEHRTLWLIIAILTVIFIAYNVSKLIVPTTSIPFEEPPATTIKESTLTDDSYFMVKHIDKKITSDNRQRWSVNVNFLPNYSYLIDDNQVTINWLDINTEPTVITSSSSGHWKVFANNGSSLIIEQRKLGIDNMRITIDPGHGGSEHGTYGRQSGVLEKDIVLDIALLLEKELTARNVNVQLTRIEDSPVYSGVPFDIASDLLARVDQAKDFETDLFISIHADNYPSNLSVRGTTSFYYNSIHEHQTNESYMIANLVGSAVASALGTLWRGALPNDYRVLKYNPFAAVLLETAFLSNRVEEAKLLDQTYRLAIVHAIADSIQQYYE